MKIRNCPFREFQGSEVPRTRILGTEKFQLHVRGLQVPLDEWRSHSERKHERATGSARFS